MSHHSPQLGILFRTGLALTFLAALPIHAASLLVEAENILEHGGWKLDTQFIHEMGSPYLLAHGMGTPVTDATETVTFPEAGTYHVYVRTKDWVARWEAPGAPGKFRVAIDGTPLEEVFGDKGAEWHWEYGGTVAVKETATIALQQCHTHLHRT